MSLHSPYPTLNSVDPLKKDIANQKSDNNQNKRYQVLNQKKKWFIVFNWVPNLCFSKRDIKLFWESLKHLSLFLYPSKKKKEQEK